MKINKRIIVLSVVLGSVLTISDAPQSFVKKKKNAPSITQCGDLGVDLLQQSAQIVADLGILQQRLIKISRDIIDNDKKCYLASATKEQLQKYYDETERCKHALEHAHSQIDAYATYIETIV
jgi:peptidoglycan hydrolase CwlO-like protein